MEVLVFTFTKLVRWTNMLESQSARKFLFYQIVRSVKKSVIFEVDAEDQRLRNPCCWYFLASEGRYLLESFASHKGVN